MQPTENCYQNGKFIIFKEDSPAMQEVKDAWNSSSFREDPNYMDGIKQYWIIRNHPEENRIIQKIWEENAVKDSPFLAEIMPKIKKLEQIGKEMREAFSPPKKDFIDKFIDEHPHQSTVVSVACIVVTVAIFFLRPIIRK